MQYEPTAAAGMAAPETPSFDREALAGFLAAGDSLGYWRGLHVETGDPLALVHATVTGFGLMLGQLGGQRAFDQARGLALTLAEADYAMRMGLTPPMPGRRMAPRPQPRNSRAAGPGPAPAPAELERLASLQGEDFDRAFQATFGQPALGGPTTRRGG